MSTLPTLYEYYTDGGITHGLSVDQPYFTLNNRNISLYSGAMHYFRVPKEYWRDRLRKMRAAGLNAVETYVPWNLHEPEPGTYDFGDGGTDMQDFLDIETFLRTAQEEDLLAIVRPGPFICAEFEFGGLPSWLLREKGIILRTSDEKFMKHVTRYFNVLLTLLAAFQFTVGGPIVAFQIENEYGSMEKTTNPPFVPDSVYIEQLRMLMLSNNITELLFTSDNPSLHGSIGSLPSLFQTANFKTKPEENFDKLKELQKGKPHMAMEFWAGWFNHWSEAKYEDDVTQFKDVLERIMKYPASVNLYMFHGGTTWGFLNGANTDIGKDQQTYLPDITSYDYNAPLTESGCYTEKYHIVKELIKKYATVETKLPELPALKERIAYPNVKIERYLPYSEIVAQLPYKVENRELISMENLPINNNTGQSFGYILYRKRHVSMNPKSVLKILGYVHDYVHIYINNELVDSFGYWKTKNSTLVLNLNRKLVDVTLDLLVENMGRVNFGFLMQLYQYKGLWQGVLLNDMELFDWEIYPMEFKKSWIKNLSNWKDFGADNLQSRTGLYLGNLVVDDARDTFVDMSGWKKGIVIVNNFVLGRYFMIGPQQSLYLPAPLLRSGNNEIIIFEQILANSTIPFSHDPIYFNNFTDIVIN